ncbi:RNA polymerase sigma factor [Roseimaritima sediminicola]|uniref:RNA polymerase sigma factor n=1 Tax=Roseimaritima sediminicola TaxID=2662066 RepID=UPI001F1ECCB9|nr:sigma-70 family RNA polymerase sigma factor [Roseimaritima sediminicola]
MPVASTHDRVEQLGRLVDQYQLQLLAYAQRLSGGDLERAQDAVQETFLRLCREDLSRLEGRIAPWLFAVCRTRVIDMQRTTPPTQISSDQVADTAATQDGPAEHAQWSDEQQRLAAQLSRLPSRQQEVLRLRLQAGLTYREIAEVTGTTVNNVGVQLHQAIRTLRQRMAAT